MQWLVYHGTVNFFPQTSSKEVTIRGLFGIKMAPQLFEHQRSHCSGGKFPQFLFQPRQPLPTQQQPHLYPFSKLRILYHRAIGGQQIGELAVKAVVHIQLQLYRRTHMKDLRGVHRAFGALGVGPHQPAGPQQHPAEIPGHHHRYIHQLFPEQHLQYRASRCALGIPNIGLANAKVICREYQNDLERMLEAPAEELAAIDGVGPVIAGAFVDYFAQEKNRKALDALLGEVTLQKETFDQGDLPLAGKSFVITGSLNHFENRSALKERIEGLGGKVTGSVTGKTVCLINNDSQSASAKNKKARELGVEVLTEEEFMERFLEEGKRSAD